MPANPPQRATWASSRMVFALPEPLVGTYVPWATQTSHEAKPPLETREPAAFRPACTVAKASDQEPPPFESSPVAPFT